MFFVLPVLLASGAKSGGTESARLIARGTKGATAIPLAVTNEGASRMRCEAALAHWYSLSLGEAGPGEAVRATLWLDPQSGEVAIRNQGGDRMPVEALWCGVAGDSFATRSVVALPNRAGSAPAPIRLACAEDGERLRCRPR
jgi:hypothetical protein